MIVDLQAIREEMNEYALLMGEPESNLRRIPFSDREQSFIEYTNQATGLFDTMDIHWLEYATVPAKNICKARFPKSDAKLILAAIKAAIDEDDFPSSYDREVARLKYKCIRDIISYTAIAICREGDRYDESLGVSVAINIWLKHFRDVTAQYIGNLKALTDRYAKSTKAHLDSFSHFIKAQGKAIDSRIAWNNTCPSKKKHYHGGRQRYHDMNRQQRRAMAKQDRHGIYHPDFGRN